MLPLSNSSIGRKLFFNIVPRERSIPNTDAESVDDVVEASRSAVVKPMPNEGTNAPESHHIKKPVNRAVSTTPPVANIIPGRIIGFISRNLVSNPPEKE